MIEAAQNEMMKTALQSIQLPSEELQVFGRARCNVHITVLGRDTADKWASVLAKFCGKVSVIATCWDAKHNTNTVMKPTKRHGYRVYGIV